MCKQKLLLFLNLLVLFCAVSEVRASDSATPTTGECGPSELRCTNGDCIEYDRRCDQKLDCPDGSDEVDCDGQFYPSLIRPARAVNSTSNDTSQILPSTKSHSPTPTSTKKNRKGKILKKTSKETNDAYEETLHLLEEGDREIELRPDYRDLVLVAGLTGAGKTTITKFITNPNDLEAYDTGDRILIRDIVNNSIIATSKVVSKTIFPQLLIHAPSNTAFYDLPGFSDTRNPTIEISNAFYMKKVAEHAERVKILLIVSHKGLRNGGHRNDIKNLIEHVIRFVKDIRKFSKGVVLVASKVEDTRSNLRVVNFVGEFLKEVEKDLDQIFQDPQKLRHARTFLSALLEKDETGKYKRIGIFKQPREVGPLMNNSDFTTNQKQVKDLVLRKAQFVRSARGDFGFSVSADSILFAKELATKTKKKVDLLLEELAEVIEEELFEYPGNSSASSDSLPWPLLKKWTLQHSIFHQMTNVLDEVGNCSEFIQVLNDTLSVFSVPGADEVILDLFKVNEQVGFFEKITLKHEAPPQKWINTFDKLKTRVEKKTKKLAEELNNHVMGITKAILKSLKDQTQSLMSTATANATRATESNNSLPHQTLDTKTLFEHLTEDFNSINRMLSQMLTTSNFAQFSKIMLNGLENTHFKLPPSILASLEDIDFDMNFNSGINGEPFPFKIDIWTNPIELLAVFLQSQIQKLSFHLSEMMKQNEAKMNQQLSTLRKEARMAVEKAKEEARRLAREFEDRENSMNGSMVTLREEMAKVQQEREQERELSKQRRAEAELVRQQERNATEIQLKEHREELQREREKAELVRQQERNATQIQLRLYEESFKKLRDEAERVRQEAHNATQIKLKEQEESYNRSLIEAERKRQKAHNATQIQLRLHEESFKKLRDEAERVRQMERNATQIQLRLHEESLQKIKEEADRVRQEERNATQIQLKEHREELQREREKAERVRQKAHNATQLRLKEEKETLQKEKDDAERMRQKERDAVQQQLRERHREKHYMYEGSLCPKPCHNTGTDYYYCYQTNGSWGKCSPRSGTTIKGVSCIGSCTLGRARYYWCYTDHQKNWDYCGLVV